MKYRFSMLSVEVRSFVGLKRSTWVVLVGVDLSTSLEGTGAAVNRRQRGYRAKIWTAMTVIFLGTAWLIGIWLSSVVGLPIWLWLMAGTASLTIAITARRQPSAATWLAMAGFLCLGAARYESAQPVIDENHIASYNEQDDLTISGRVVDEPDVRDRATTLKIEAENIELPDGRSYPVTGLLLATVSRYPEVPYGAELALTGELQTPVSDAEFDYKAYLARQDVHSQMIRPSVTVLAEGQGSPIYEAIYAFKDRAQATINNLLPNPHAALLSGILLGNDNELSPALSEDFRITGMTHIIAISGFNIAILSAILLRGSRPFVGLKGSAWVALVGVGLYTILVGADAAVVRAAIMGATFIIASRFMGRPTFAAAGLFTAAILMTLANPFVLWDVGFQLSFAATLGLMIYVRPWKTWTEAGSQRIVSPMLARRFVRFFGDIVIATLAALLLTMPLMAYHFGHLSVVSPLANLFVLPAQAGIMSWGILSTLAGMVFQPLGQLLAWITWLFLNYTIDRVRFFATLPSASVELPVTAAVVVAVYAVILALTWLSGRRPIKPGLWGRFSDGSILGRLRWGAVISGLALAAWLAVSWSFSQYDGQLHVSFLDVGQGDATLITTPGGRHILVDGGAYPSVLKAELGRLLPFWEKELDLVIATHPDSDHVAALPTLFDHYQIARLITNGQEAEETAYQQLLSAAAGSGTPVHEALAGEVVVIGDGLRLAFLNPTGRQLPAASGQHDNDFSVALRLTYEDFSLLLTGDAGQEVEQQMAANGGTLAAVVYKAGHHGADSSNGALFLSSVGPEIAVISAGEDNRYGHPHPAVLERLADAGAAVLRTDELGTIEVISDGKKMWWQAEGK